MPGRIVKLPGADGIGDKSRLTDRLGQCTHALDKPEDLDRLIDRIGDAQIVLLGEASHGTSEYYLWRQILSKRLIEEKGFSFVAVEGDWPDCYRINRYIKGEAGSGDSARDVLNGFNRWPTWMWANHEMVHFATWLRKWNDQRPVERKIGFYGLDVYSLWESMEEVIRYLEKHNPSAAQIAKQAFGCFEPYSGEVESYARAAALISDSCEEEVVAALALLRRSVPNLSTGREAGFNAEQNGEIVKNAERYYRTMMFGGSASWNIRDFHMADTLDRLMRFHGEDAKAIVWEHNTHIGDARATDMAKKGMINVGQIVRERYGERNVILAGFGSYRGSVIAAEEWGAPMQRMRVPEGELGSLEDLFHRIGKKNRLFICDEWPPGPYDMEQPIGHRAIGVVYDPLRERFGNYVPTRLLSRYDAFLYIETTQALHPLHIAASREEIPETFPFAV